MTNNLTTVASTDQLNINTPKYYNQFRSIQLILVKITNPYIFIISCLGLITNTLTIAFLSRSFLTKNLRHKWTLIALAVSDLILNIALLIRVVRDVNKWKVQGLCETISFLSHLAAILSACFTVLFTIQRYTAVRYPFQVAVQKRSSPIFPLAFILTFGVTFCFALIRYNDVHVTCQEELKLDWFIADALCSFIIPFSLILLFNLSIVNLIRKHSRSSISANSTLPRSAIRNKHSTHRSTRKGSPHEESYSMSSLYAYSPTLNEPLPDNDVDRNFNSTHTPVKREESLSSAKKKESAVFYNGTKDVACLVTEVPATMVSEFVEYS